MSCVICKGDKITIALPVYVEEEKQFYEANFCLGCARKSSSYCPTHSQPKVGWTGGATICLRCSEELAIGSFFKRATYSAMLKEAAPEDFKIFEEEATNRNLSEGARDVQIITYLSRAALASKISIEELVRQIVAAESLDILKKPA